MASQMLILLLASMLSATSGSKSGLSPLFSWNRGHRVSNLSASAQCTVPCTSDALISIRGGEVEIITSLSEVEDFIEEASEDQLIVLDFASNNCHPCEMIAPIYDDMSNLEEFSKRVRFLKVNVSNHPDIAERYGVDGWPTFLLFKGRERVDEIEGGQAAKAGLYPLITKYVS